MTFSDAAKSSMLEYHTLYASLGSYLDHAFMTIGNGMEWHNGALHGSGEEYNPQLAALERLAVNPNRTKQKLPYWLKYPLHYDEFPTDIPARTQNPVVYSCYGYHNEYSRISRIPDNVQPDWLDACILYLVSISQTPQENFSRNNMARDEKEKGYATDEFNNTQTAIRRIFGELQQRFPTHQFHNPMKTMTFDPNRPDTNTNYWPLDGSTVPVADLIAPFKAALEFAYNIKPKPGTPKGKLTRLFKKVADTAIKLGQQIINNEVVKELSYRTLKPVDGKPHPLSAVVIKYPHGETTYFEDIVDPLLKEFRKYFRLSRKNRKKDIPYTGFPNGRASRAGCLEPVNHFMADQMEYDETDQGRDGLTVIIGQMITTMTEQGRRMVVNDVYAACEKNYPAEDFDFDYDGDEKRQKRLTAQSNLDLEQRINSILTELEGTGWQQYRL